MKDNLMPLELEEVQIEQAFEDVIEGYLTIEEPYWASMVIVQSVRDMFLRRANAVDKSHK